MKGLVYGSGVIGSYPAHLLCSVENDVTVLARGRWWEQLEACGLRMLSIAEQIKTWREKKDAEEAQRRYTMWLNSDEREGRHPSHGGASWHSWKPL